MRRIISVVTLILSLSYSLYGDIPYELEYRISSIPLSKDSYSIYIRDWIVVRRLPLGTHIRKPELENPAFPVYPKALFGTNNKWPWGFRGLRGLDLIGIGEGT